MSATGIPTESFASIVDLDISDGPPRFTADARSLAVFRADGLPVGQQWLAEGEPATVTPEITERIARRRVRQQPASNIDKASVVICTRDRPGELRRCLASFSQQSRPPDEIIVVDNASLDDRTRQVVLAAGATYVREDRPGLDFARNSGARAATGEIILYTDDDTELHPLWIENTLAAFDAPEIAAITGLVLPARLQTEAQWIFETQWSFGRGFDRNRLRPRILREPSLPWLPGMDHRCRRQHGVPPLDLRRDRLFRRAARCRPSGLLGRFGILVPGPRGRLRLPVRAYRRDAAPSTAGDAGAGQPDLSLHARPLPPP